MFKNRKHTVIFVENKLFLSGISEILRYYHFKIQELEIKQLLNAESITSNYLYICEVCSIDLEKTVQDTISTLNTLNIIVIKDHLNIVEVSRLLDLGIKGFLLSDLDEPFFVNAVKQVQNGHLCFDYRFTIELLIRYKSNNDIHKKTDSTRLLKTLTKRELEILFLLTEGYTTQEIADKLYISENTARNHVSKILFKLNVKDRLNAVLKAVKNNWFNLEGKLEVD